jgi:hypothetical protein
MSREEPKIHSAGIQAPWPGTTEDQIKSSHPSPQGGNFLIDIFIEKVDPFVRILHKPTLLLQVNHFRRGILSGPEKFECLLFTVYSLALLAVDPQKCLDYLEEDRDTLLARYRQCVEHRLNDLRISTTHKLPSLQAYLLHIVRPTHPVSDW